MSFWNNLPRYISRSVPLKHLKGAFAKNTLWMILSFGWRVLVNIIYFLLVARTLKPAEYGTFAGALALEQTITPFVTWGSGNILIKYISRKSEEFSRYWGMALSVSFSSAFVMGAIAFISAWFILSPQAAVHLVLPITVGDFLGERYAYLSSQAFQAFKKLSRTSIILAAVGFYRILSAVLFLFLPIQKTAHNWALLFMLSGFLSGATGLIWVARELGWGRFTFTPMRGEWVQGFYFSMGLSATGAYDDIDKTILNRMGSSAITGDYTAAYRIMDAASIPAQAMLYASYPRFFQEGEKGMEPSVRYALRLLPWSAGFGLISVLALFLGAPMLPLVLGKEYASTLIILPWIALIPFFRSIHWLAANALTGAGHQGLRTGLQVGIALINLALNLIWIPIYSWKGAAWSSLFSDGILAIVIWVICIGMAWGERKAKA